MVYNLYAKKGEGQNLCFAGHTDVVPAGPLKEWKFPPFKAEINKIILCTTKKGIDDILCRIAKKNSINYVRGPEEDVLSRMLLACKKNNEIIK